MISGPNHFDLPLREVVDASFGEGAVHDTFVFNSGFHTPVELNSDAQEPAGTAASEVPLTNDFGPIELSFGDLDVLHDQLHLSIHAIFQHTELGWFPLDTVL